VHFVDDVEIKDNIVFNKEETGKNKFEIALYLRLTSVSVTGDNKEHCESVRGLECGILQIYFTVGPIICLPYHGINILQKCSLANAGVVNKTQWFFKKYR